MSPVVLFLSLSSLILYPLVQVPRLCCKEVEEQNDLRILGAAILSSTLSFCATVQNLRVARNIPITLKQINYLRDLFKQISLLYLFQETATNVE